MMNWLGQFRRDVQFGVRGLIRTPGFTVLAVLSLALGIMAVTAIYSVLYAVVLDPFPYKDVDKLMSVRVWNPAQRGFRTGYSTDQFLEIAERSTIFEGVIASTISDVLWTGAGDPQRLRGNHGTFNTFDVMGVPPLRRPHPDRRPTPGRARSRWWSWAIVSGSGSSAAIPTCSGRALRLNDITRTVIGVMPKRFMWRGADVYLPITFERGQGRRGGARRAPARTPRSAASARRRRRPISGRSSPT